MKGKKKKLAVNKSLLDTSTASIDSPSKKSSHNRNMPKTPP